MKTFEQRIDHYTRIIFDYIIFLLLMSIVRGKHMEHGPRVTKTVF